MKGLSQARAGGLCGLDGGDKLDSFNLIFGVKNFWSVSIYSGIGTFASILLQWTIDVTSFSSCSSFPHRSVLITSSRIVISLYRIGDLIGNAKCRTDDNNHKI